MAMEVVEEGQIAIDILGFTCDFLNVNEVSGEMTASFGGKHMLTSLCDLVCNFLINLKSSLRPRGEKCYLSTEPSLPPTTSGCPRFLRDRGTHKTNNR